MTASRRLSELMVIDVREPYEWDAGHIAGAVHIPMDQLLSRRGEIPEDREVVFVCRVGGRSGQATEYFAREGYKVENLDGGMLGWEAARLPIVTDAGDPGTVATH